jgi:uncharacterized repeat protein (TIGR03803 family)
MRNIRAQRRKKPEVFELSSSFQLQERNGGTALLRAVCILFLLCAAAAITSPAATKFKSLVSFNGTNGRNPNLTAVVQGLDGNLYGTTEIGGTNNAGTVFKITPGGTLATIYNFCAQSNCPDGAKPEAGLILATDGNFYGTTVAGGTIGAGTVFKITPAGKLITLYNFCSQSGCVDGLNPDAPVFQGTDGNFYGTTKLGGKHGCGGCHGAGTAFKITPAGKLTTIYNFCAQSNCDDGANPTTGLVQGTDGNFYGTTLDGGTKGAGTVFKMTPKGVLTTLYNFCSLSGCTDGINPFGALVQGTDGNFYGTTDGDDSNNGTVFKITPAGKLTTLADFKVSGDNAVPLAGLVQGTDGNFYGSAFTNFPNGNCCGGVFKLTPAGKYTVIHQFVGTDGDGPYGLFQYTGGALYGVTAAGGTANIGTVFDVSVGLKPFVELLPNNGKVGKTIDILGQGFTGATGVSFDGVAATFNNVSDTYLTAVVPAGALTGTVTVTTFTTSYKSSKIFRVTPQLTSFSPSSGVVGSSVTLTGVSLTQTTVVTIGGKTTSFKVDSDTQVTATVPPNAKTGQKITIATLGGTAASTADFVVVPFVGSFSPLKGPVGTQVTINGTSFTGTTKVTFGGVAATSFQVINDSQVDAIVPTGAKTGKIQVTTPGGTGTSATNFTVT